MYTDGSLPTGTGTSQSRREQVEGIMRRLTMLEENEELLHEVNYCGRTGAQDQLEFGVIDPVSRLRKAVTQSDGAFPGAEGEFSKTLDAIAERAGTLRRRFETLDISFLEGLRGQIRNGLPGATLRAILDGQAPGRHHVANSPGYDALDGLLADLLFPVSGPNPALDREPEMVFYQPTPARVVLDLVDRMEVGKDDLFIDIGSGLGLVPMLVNALTGVRAKGIEFDPAYSNYAAHCATDLSLGDVEFVNIDARDADYGDGTIFFLYTPFSGRMLQEVLDRIDSQRRNRPITICSFGPCTEAIAAQRWLQPVGPVDDDHTLAMFRAV